MLALGNGRIFVANANLLSTLIAALCGFLVGGIWYGPLFGKAWQRAAGLSNQQIAATNSVKLYGTTLVLSIISAIFLGHLLKSTGVSKPHVIMMISIGIALGFIIPAIATNYLFARKSMGLLAIDAGYWVFFYAAMGAVYLLMGV
jgi:Protein of unknown function (DUF1761)